jgi:MFS family permease
LLVGLRLRKGPALLGSKESRPPLFYGWVLVGVVFFIAFVSTGARNGFGVFVTPMEAEFGWNRTATSVVFMVATLVGGVSQPFIGRIYDRIGARGVMLVSLVVIGTFTALLGLTVNLLFLVLVYGVVVAIGTSGASINIGGALLARWFRRKRATVMAIATSGSSVGGMILVPFSAYMMDLTSWRTTWVFLGGLVLVLVLPLAFFLLRERPSDMGLQPDGVVDPPSDGEKAGAQPGRTPLDADRWLESFRSFPIWQLSTAYFVCGFTTSIISMHFVPWAEDAGYSRSIAATAFGLLTGLNTVGVIAAGALGDRFTRKNVLAAVYWLRGVGFVTLLLAPMPWNLWGFAVMTGFSWIATIPLTATLTADIYGLRNLATLNGISFMSHQIGGSISVLLAGALFDLYDSYNIPFTLCCLLLVGAGMTAFSIREKQYSVKYQSQQTLRSSSAAT